MEERQEFKKKGLAFEKDLLSKNASLSYYLILPKGNDLVKNGKVLRKEPSEVISIRNGRRNRGE